MKKPTFGQGVVVAAVLALVASIVIAGLTPFVGFASVVRLAIPSLAIAYMIYLFRCSDERSGRITTLVLWIALAIVTWWASPALPLYVLVHVGAVWLVRSLYFYSGFFPAVIDLGLNAMSVLAFIWAISQTGSIFLATWSFFLVQALFVAIPASIGGRKRRPAPGSVDNELFERARKQADRALQQLFTQ